MGAPIIVPPLSAGSAPVIEWIDPTGTARLLTNADYCDVGYGVLGLGMPNFGLEADKLPFLSGSVVRHLTIPDRMITLPLRFKAETAAAMDDVMDDVHQWFATGDEQSQTPGYLRVTRRDGSQRQVRCFYRGGLEGNQSLGPSGQVWQYATIQLESVDPWAADPAESTVSWLAAGLAAPVAVMNDGHLPAYTRFQISGPASNPIILVNTTTGRTIRIEWDLPDDYVLYIDTRPAPYRDTLSIYDSTGVNRFDKLHPGSFLWSLNPGSNTLDVTLTGTDGGTSVALYWLQRYRGLLR